jgi:hypothetical protein
MGVYVFRSLHAPYVKVGHHLVSPRRPNAYYRVAGRGFHSVIHPDELDGKLWLEDLELMGWFPSLGRADETRVHRACTARVGEFHPADDLPLILQTCAALGGVDTVIPEAAKRRAVAWGRRAARRGKRRKARKV